VRYGLNLVGVEVRCYTVREALNQQGVMLFCVGGKNEKQLRRGFLCIEVSYRQLRE
jgi:hypothetical protein